MRVLVSGATGFIGTALLPLLRSRGHEVVRLSRRPSSKGESEVVWDPDEGTLEASALQGIEGVIHLAGENVFALRWTDQKKARIMDSRVRGTELLSRVLASLDPKPRVLVSTSAVGIYGDCGDEPVAEDAPAGDTFLAKVCLAWEGAAQAARDAGIRVVHPRIGLVLDPEGGALKMMLPAFRMGVGGVLGNGRQYMPWITRDDLLLALERCLTDDSLTGPVNTAAPNPVTNREFTATLGRTLLRPAMLPVPGPALKLVLGQVADEMLLSSCRAQPARLHAAGFTFRDPLLEPALHKLLPR